MSKKTRASMMNLWEACEDGKLERVRVYLSNVNRYVRAKQPE